MVVHALQMKATLGNVVEFRIPEDHTFHIDIEQGGEVVKKDVEINREDTYEIEGSKGIANLVFTTLKANLTIKDEKTVDGTYCADDSEQWKTVAVIESRGCEVGNWTLTGGYQVISENDEGNRQTFKDCDVNKDSEFNDVDEDGKPVTIYEPETRVVVFKA